MVSILKSLKEHISGYTVFLMLISSFILIFIDRRQLKQAKLKKEAMFSFYAGIIYLALTLIMIILAVF